GAVHHCEVRGDHQDVVVLQPLVRICWCRDRRSIPLQRPLPGPAGTRRRLPLVAVQVLQEIVVPLHRVRGPCALQPAGDGIAAFAAAVAVLPAEALLLERSTLRLWTNILGRRGSAMGFAEGVSAD